MKMPTLFISHGPPVVAVKDCPAHEFLVRLGRNLPTPEAIVCISAHWESTVPLVTGGSEPGIQYDFGGLRALRQLTYDLPGLPDLTEKILLMLNDPALCAQSMTRAFDHGVWIPLMMMYPQKAVPTVQISIQTEADPAHHYRLGEALAPLRESGVLIMASGGAVHNLDEVHEHAADADPPEYVRQFDGWLENRIVGGHASDLLDYQVQAPNPRRSHPYPAEHFLPLFVALGAAGGVPGRRLHDSFLMGTLSMAAYAWE